MGFKIVHENVTELNESINDTVKRVFGVDWAHDTLDETGVKVLNKFIEDELNKKGE